MTREEQDEMEFEEWWKGLDPINLIINKKSSIMDWMRESWLASRRTMRERIFIYGTANDTRGE